jgi:hypothetical protein
MTDLFGNPVEEPAKTFNDEPTPEQMARDAKAFWERMCAVHGEKSPVAVSAYQGYMKLKMEAGL